MVKDNLQDNLRLQPISNDELHKATCSSDRGCARPSESLSHETSLPPRMPQHLRQLRRPNWNIPRFVCIVAPP